MDEDKAKQANVPNVLYRFQFKSYLPIAAKRGKALAPRFPQPLCQIGLNLESVL